MKLTSSQGPQRQRRSLIEARFVLAARRVQRRSSTHAATAEGVVVSLTSFPARIGTVYLTVESLLAQTLLPERIILYLSRSEFSDSLPKALIRRASERFEIRLVNGDYRSYTKLVHALRDFPDKAIVTCDDDLVYPTHLIRRLVHAHRAHPRDIVAARARRMVASAEGFAPYSDWRIVRNQPESSHWLFPTGVGGVLYPPESLHGDAIKPALFQALAPYADDVWFKAMALLKGTMCRAIPWRKRNYVPLWQIKDQGLHLRNVVRGENDIQLRRTFDFYGIGPDFIAAREKGLVSIGAENSSVEIGASA